MTHPARNTLAAMPYVLAGSLILAAIWAVACCIAWLCGYDLLHWHVGDYSGFTLE